MAKMFGEYTDQNGVEIGCNAHPVTDYESRPLKPSYHHMMWDSELGRYVEKPGSNIAHRTKDQVFRHIGDRVGTMSFTTELAGPGDRDDLGASLNAAVPMTSKRRR
jgi:hypothetical protein